MLELKAEKEYNKAHEAQLIIYLKASTIKLGYLMNFGKINSNLNESYFNLVFFGGKEN